MAFTHPAADVPSSYSSHLTNNSDKTTWRTIQSPSNKCHACKWVLAVVACVVVVVVVLAAVAATVKMAAPWLSLNNADGAVKEVGLLLTGTPLDADVRDVFHLVARHNGAKVLLLEGTVGGTPEGVVEAFTELWQTGVRVFLVGGGAVQMEALCHYLQQTRKEALLVSLTTDADTPCCSSSNSSLLVSLSPSPTALLAVEVAGLAEGGVTSIVPVLTRSQTGASLLHGLRAVAAARNVTVVTPVYLDVVRPSIRQLSQVLAALPGAAVWLAADYHLPHLMAPLRDVLHGRVVILHAHPVHLAALLTHPVARAAAEACAVTTVQWAGPSRVDDPTYRRLLAALTPTDPLATALAYHAATLAVDAAVHGRARNLTQFKARLMEEVGGWSATHAEEQVARPTAGWAARLRLVTQQLMRTMVMQDSPWLLEGMSRVQEGDGQSSWVVRGTHAPARLLIREEVQQLVEHTDCGSLARVEVRAHDPLTHRPVITSWHAHDAPDALLVPNFSPRGFSVTVRCQDHAGKEVEVGCQGAAAHNESLSCVVVVSGGARGRREVNNVITHHGLPDKWYESGDLKLVKRKIKGLFKHPDFRAFVPQLGACLGASGGCSYCFVFILGRNVTVTPGVCYGSCAVAIGAACISLFAKGTEYKLSQTVICTELFTQGQLSWDSYVADAAYGARLAVTNPQALRGYRMVAGPLVAAMQVNPTLTSLVETLARPWVRHMEFEEGVTATDDPVGRFMTTLGLPLCSAVALLHDHILTAGLLVLITAFTRHVLK